MATEKQVNYALMLLREAGYNTRYMDARFKELGAKMRQRSGLVEDWLKQMNVAETSDLIERLKRKVEGKEQS